MGLNSFLVCVEFTVLGMGKFGTWAVTKNFFGFSPEQGITAQVVSCLMCDVPTHGVWGQEQWVRQGVNRAVVPIATNQENARPSGVRGGALLLFPWAHASEAGVSPCRFFPFPVPMDEVHGIEFFFGVR